MKTFIFATFISLFALVFFALPVAAQMQIEGEGIMMRNMGPLFFGHMLHAWVSLGAAIVIFTLVLKYMTGGKLSRPIMLIGLGALGDAVFGLVLAPEVHMQYMWLGSLIFSLSVIIGIVWMGKIFGVFQK